MRTRRIGMRSIVVAVAFLCWSVPVAAQTDLFDLDPGRRHVDISGSGGFLLSTDWSDLVVLGATSPATGALEQVLVRDLVVRPGPVFDAVVTYWEGRYGFRSHVGFSSSCLAAGRSCDALAGPRGAAGSVDVKAWMYDIGGAVGLIDYRRDTWVWPYVFLGFGGVTYDLERPIGPPLTFIEESAPRSGDGRINVTRTDPGTLLIAIDELNLETRFATNFGVGTDIRIPTHFASVGLRVEVSDLVHRSPVSLVIADVEGRGANTRVDFGLVHNLRAAAGMVIHFGR